MTTLKIKGGTVVHLDGLPVMLSGDTDVETENFDALRQFSTTPYQEYPKMLADGTILNGPPVPVAEPEPEPEPAAAPDPEPVPAEPANPLDDVSVEMDDPTFDAPTTKKAAKKK